MPDQGPAEALKVLGDIPTPAALTATLVDHELRAPPALPHPAIDYHLDGLVSIEMLEIRESPRRVPRDDHQEPTPDGLACLLRARDHG
jgi:hypothetical protein